MINLKLNSHFETELKLHIPQTGCASFEKALKRGAVQTIHLRAMYFDTPERQLARQKVALRLRLENAGLEISDSASGQSWSWR